MSFVSLKRVKTVFENNQLKRVSLTGLKKDHKDIYSKYTKSLLDKEQYENLASLSDDEFDKNFLIWVDLKARLVFLIENINEFNQIEALALSFKTSIKFEEFSNS